MSAILAGWVGLTGNGEARREYFGELIQIDESQSTFDYMQGTKLYLNQGRADMVCECGLPRVILAHTAHDMPRHLILVHPTDSLREIRSRESPIR